MNIITMIQKRGNLNDKIFAETWACTLYGEMVVLAGFALRVGSHTRVSATVRKLWSCNLKLTAPGEDVHLQRLWIL